MQADERNKEQLNFILENAGLKNKVENLENKIEELQKLSETSDKIKEKILELRRRKIVFSKISTPSHIS